MREHHATFWRILTWNRGALMWLKSIAILTVALYLWRWFSLPVEDVEDEVLFIDTPEVIQRHGYPVETHLVKSADGYLITLHRIPGKGRPVLVQHGILQSSASFVITEPGHALGYQLADSGYDVWLGNSRGNSYSRGHINSSISRRQYWDFSFHEMGVYDLPATIDTILNVTGRNKLHYIGFSMGSTMFFIMTSVLPEYNNKVASMVALAPAVFVNHVSSTMFYYFNVGSLSLQWLLDAAGIYQVFPRTYFNAALANMLCRNELMTRTICGGLYGLIGGHTPDNMNTTTLSLIYGHDPSGTSRKTAAHYGQLVLSGKFAEYDYYSENVFKYGQLEPPHYDLSKVTVPVTIFFGSLDTIATPQDVEMLFSRLTQSWRKNIVELRGYSHMDFTCGKDADKQVYQRIVSILDSSQ